MAKMAFLVLLATLSTLASGQKCANVPKINLSLPPNERGAANYEADKTACFNNLAPTRSGKRGQRIRFEDCKQTDTISCNGGYKYQLDEIRVSGAALAEKGMRTVLFRDSTIRMCMFGRMDPKFVKSAKLQFSVHGNIEHILDNLFDPAVPFCEIGVDLCKERGSTCDRIQPAASEPTNFCSCTTINVPNVPGNDKIRVRTSLKALESPDESSLNTCETEFDIDDLKADKNKNTLACVVIPSLLGKARPQINRRRR